MAPLFFCLPITAFPIVVTIADSAGFIPRPDRAAGHPPSEPVRPSESRTAEIFLVSINTPS